MAWLCGMQMDEEVAGLTVRVRQLRADKRRLLGTRKTDSLQETAQAVMVRGGVRHARLACARIAGATDICPAPQRARGRCHLCKVPRVRSCG